MNILAIDPGNIESAYCVIDAETYKPILFEKAENDKVMSVLSGQVFSGNIGKVPIEMIAHYGCGMPAGKSVFDTCVWIGRYMQQVETINRNITQLIYRSDEKMVICGTMKAKDSNIIQALVDRFAPNEPNRGKGTKKNPGWFYGFKADIWQAYAVGVAYLDMEAGR